METLKKYGFTPSFGLLNALSPEALYEFEADSLFEPLVNTVAIGINIFGYNAEGRAPTVLGGILGMDLIICYIQNRTRTNRRSTAAGA